MICGDDVVIVRRGVGVFRGKRRRCHCAEGTNKMSLTCSDPKEVRWKSFRQREERGRDGEVGMCFARPKAEAVTGIVQGTWEA